MRHLVLLACVSVMTFLITGCGAAEFSSKGSADDGSQAQQDVNVDEVDGDLESDDDPNNIPEPGVEHSCGKKKRLICHVPEGNPANRHTLCLPNPAIEAHLREHDSSAAAGDEDHLGDCN